MHAMAALVCRAVRRRGLVLIDRDPVLLAVVCTVSVLGAWYATHPAGGSGHVVLAWATILVLHVVFTVCSGRATGLAGRGDPARRLYLALTVAGMLYVTGSAVQVAQAIYDPTALASVQGSMVRKALFGVGLASVLLTMLTFPLAIGSLRERVCFWLDMATVLISTACFGWYLTLSGVDAELPERRQLSELAGLAAQPVLFLVLAFAVAKLLMSGRAPFVRTAGLLGTAGAAAEGIAQGAAPTLIGSGRTNWYLALCMLGTALLAMALRVQQLAMRDAPASARWQRRRSYSLLPYLAVAAMYVLLLVALGPEFYFRHWVVLTGGIASTALVVARQILAFEDNARLLGELRQALDERDALQSQLRTMAFSDSLTGLANRAMFDQRAQHAFAASRRDGRSVAVMLIDLDDFKPVNDLLGHAAGDAVLTEVGRRVLRCLRETDTVARLGGDEFAVLLHDPRLEDLDAIAGRVVAAIGAPYAIDGVPVTVGASVGVAADRPARTDVDALLREADAAMYAAKSAGKGAHRVRIAAGALLEVPAAG